MELDEVKSITINLGNGKYVKLLQTVCITQKLGDQVDILSCPKSEQMLFFPSGALLSDTEVEAKFYQVVDSVALESIEFVTDVMEITPHLLEFEKAVEILMRHHLFVQDCSSKVTVLYNTGKPGDNTFTSLCQLSSSNKTCLANSMTMTLLDDFVCIQTSHICRFGLLCEGAKYIKIWASLHTVKIPHPKQFIITMYLTPDLPDPNKKFIYSAYGELECRYSKLLTLTCKDEEGLKVEVRIPQDTRGWSPREDSDRMQTISYRKIQNLVVQDRPYMSREFCFLKDETSNVDVKDFSPVFVFNDDDRCTLPSSIYCSKSDWGSVLSTSLKAKVSGE